MKLQKATYCALYAVLELARDPDVQLSATDIAEKYNISANHLAKVLRDLGRAGLVESVRGAGGGYRFSGNLKRTTLFDVIHLFEDVGGENERSRDAQADTDIGNALNMVLTEIDEIALATLGSITIGTLLKTMRWRNERAERDEAKA
ncbi:Rrf2 family transcriptional regulator [Terasakiella sp. SH-1]|uniref:Rrf2 family transcriptional regulator n=1 Tax=Terasakiella sp. SH-1 TaxID=2560057 RepID=UPI0010742F95|nr:Rrf2 family transcriptional regulator [Terasakiella sp. SH-1]